MGSLEVRALAVRYGPVEAVRGIDMRLAEGQVAVVLGANGAGKSSTVNAISGVVPCAAGSVSFDGDDITGWPANRIAAAGLVQVPEGRRVLAQLTVEENLLLGAYTVKSSARRARLLEEVYAMFPELVERRRNASGLLSGGEQQMLAFGRALMSEPRTMLLDEPSMGLAPIVIDRVMQAVESIAGRGMSILMVEQNASAAFRVASWVYVLEQGRLVRQGRVEEVRSDPLVLEAFLGTEAVPSAAES
jgi:branched-chain amino acid transport system ATP-binding protein